MADEDLRTRERAAATGGEAEAEALEAAERRAGKGPPPPEDCLVLRDPFCRRCGQSATELEAVMTFRLPIQVDRAGQRRWSLFPSTTHWPEEITDTDGEHLLGDGEAGLVDVDRRSDRQSTPDLLELAGERRVSCHNGHEWVTQAVEALAHHPDPTPAAKPDGLPF